MDIYEKLAREQLAEYDHAYAKSLEMYPRLTEEELKKNFGYTRCKTIERYYHKEFLWPIPAQDMGWLLMNAAKRYCSWGLLIREEKLTLIQIIKSSTPGDKIIAEEILSILWETNQIRKSNKLKTNNHGKTIQEKGSDPKEDNV